ncbi:MAG: hypothetical protein V3V22_05085 [Methylococcales bacterium]
MLEAWFSHVAFCNDLVYLTFDRVVWEMITGPIYFGCLLEQAASVHEFNEYCIVISILEPVQNLAEWYALLS